MTRVRFIFACAAAVALIGVTVVLAPSLGRAAGAELAGQAAGCDNTQAFQLTPRPRQGVDPLTGARFFVDGPGTNRGSAASAIARQVGRYPNGFGDITWGEFLRRISRARMSARVAHRVRLLEKIGAEPEVKRISRYTAGGGPGAIVSQMQKLMCRFHVTDPGADALISTYFLLHSGNCKTNRENGSAGADFRRRIDELAEGIGSFPTVLLLESDAIDTSPCLSHAGLADRVGLLRYAINRLAKLPHTVIYVDGGTSDGVSVGFASRVLNEIGIRKIRGFFLNATHFNWTTSEIKYGEQISKRTHGAHFIVGTQDNGRGPLLNRGGIGGTEQLCNPRGRGLGPRPTTDTGFYRDGVDAFMWVGVPGRSAGDCGAGTAPAGIFDTHFALSLAANANDRLGLHYRNRRY